MLLLKIKLSRDKPLYYVDCTNHLFKFISYCKISHINTLCKDHSFFLIFLTILHIVVKPSRLVIYDVMCCMGHFYQKNSAVYPTSHLLFQKKKQTQKRIRKFIFFSLIVLTKGKRNWLIKYKSISRRCLVLDHSHVICYVYLSKTGKWTFNNTLLSCLR